MTPEQTTNTALSLQGMLPMDGCCYCPCCSDRQLYRDDMADPEPWMIDLYGARLCKTCEDAHTECQNCHNHVLRDDMICDYHVGWICRECHAGTEEGIAEAAAEARVDAYREEF